MDTCRAIIGVRVFKVTDCVAGLCFVLKKPYAADRLTLKTMQRQSLRAIGKAITTKHYYAQFRQTLRTAIGFAMAVTLPAAVRLLAFGDSGRWRVFLKPYLCPCPSANAHLAASSSNFTSFVLIPTTGGGAWRTPPRQRPLQHGLYQLYQNAKTATGDTAETGSPLRGAEASTMKRRRMPPVTHISIHTLIQPLIHNHTHQGVER